MRLKQEFINVNIHVPILSINYDKEKIRELVSRIKEINPNHVNLLRFMPVGKASSRLDDIENYNPIEFINFFKEELHKQNCTIDYKIHCSLRSLLNTSSNCGCNMLEEKIGIDKMGNVFTCAWVSGIDYNAKKNPFYLVNLLEDDLIDILNSYNTKTKYREGKVDHCRVVSYVYSKDKSKFQYNSNNDPLYIRAN